MIERKDSEVRDALVAVGQIWKRKPPGKERIRIDRVWQGYPGIPPTAWTVRAQPLHGGVYLVCPDWDVVERYTLENESSDRKDQEAAS